MTKLLYILAGFVGLIGGIISGIVGWLLFASMWFPIIFVSAHLEHYGIPFFYSYIPIMAFLFILRVRHGNQEQRDKASNARKAW